jgi:large-conductance mechanosensitive channel
MAGLARTALNEARQDIGGFKKFIVRGSVVDVAIGVVIGAAFGNVVQALVKGVIEPLISAFGGPLRHPKPTSETTHRVYSPMAHGAECSAAAIGHEVGKVARR